jgi:hypothetical protein
LARYLAIDVDAHGLYVASGTAHRGKTAVEKVAFAPADSPSLSPGTAQALGRQLKDLLKQAGISPAPVLLCLGRDKIILKDVVHPPTTGPEEPIVVRFQAVKDLPNDPDEMELDYLPTGETTDGQKTALAVFARKDAVKAAKAFCEAAGLKMHGLTPRPFAAAAAAQAAVAAGQTEPTDDPADPVAVLTLTDAGGEFTAAKAGRVLFTRAVPGPALQSEATLVSEIRRNLAVFAASAGGEPARAVYVAEAGPPEAGWTFRLAAGLPTAVHRFDPLGGTGIGEAVPPDSRGRFAGAVGLLALAAAGPALPINFISPRQPRAEVNPNKNRLIIAGLAAGLLIAGAGVFAYMELDKLDDRIAELKGNSQKLDTEIKASEEDQNRLNAAEEFLTQKLPVHDELYEASYKFGDISKMKLTQFEYDVKPLPTEKERERTAKDQKSMTPAQKKALAANPPPVGSIKMSLSTSDSTQIDRLISAYVNDGRSPQSPGYYRDTRRSTTGGAGGGGAGGANNRNGQAQFIVTTNVVPRKPIDYRHRLPVTAPVAPAPAGGGFGDPDGGPIGDDQERENN